MKRGMTDRSNALVLAERLGEYFYVDQPLTTVLNETGRVQFSCSFRQSGAITFSDVAAPDPQVARFTRASEVRSHVQRRREEGPATTSRSKFIGIRVLKGPRRLADDPLRNSLHNLVR
jgi:hypothetical protein